MESFLFELFEKNDYRKTIRVYENKARSKVVKRNTLKKLESFILYVKQNGRKRMLNKLSFEVI